MEKIQKFQIHMQNINGNFKMWFISQRMTLQNDNLPCPTSTTIVS